MYRASSVLSTLAQSSAEIIGHQFIKCPLDRCFINPASCHKAQTHTCTQEATVLYEHNGHNKCVNLRFYFTISPTDFDGYIDEDNEFLQILIRRNIINGNDLIIV